MKGQDLRENFDKTVFAYRVIGPSRFHVVGACDGFSGRKASNGDSEI